MMKKAVKRNFTIAVSAIALGALSMGVALSSQSVQSVNVNAASVFYMEQGASIRMDTPTGIKFTANVPNNTDTYGMFIVPYDYFETYNVDVNATDYVNAFKTVENSMTYKPVVVENLAVKGTEGAYYVEHSIAPVLAENYRRDWFGVAFTNNGGTRTYATQDDNVRNVVEVAGAALNDYYYGDLQTSDPAAYDAYTANLDNMKTFVTTGVSQVATSFEYAITGEATMYVDGTQTLSVNLPDLGLTTVWKSSDTSVATVDENGKVTALKAGTVNITAKSCGIYEETLAIKIVTEEDVIAEKLLGTTRATDSAGFTQEINTDSNYVKSGANSIKATYTGDANGIHETYLTTDGGSILGIYDASPTSKYWQAWTYFSAYDEVNKTFKKDGEKTYAGFWVKNETGNELQIGFTIRSFTDKTTGAEINTGRNSRFHNYDWTVAATDTEWHYFEMNITDWCHDVIYDAGSIIRMGVGAKIAGATAGNTFYIDGFDIYHGNVLPEKDEYDTLAETLITKLQSAGFTQEINTDTANVKEGLNSIKATYTGNTNGIHETYLTTDGGSILGIYDTPNASQHKYVSAYDTTNNTYKKAGASTYVRFWVKNTTEKKLQIGFTIRTWESSTGTDVCSGTSNRFHNYSLTIEANDTEWKYVEIDITQYCSEKFDTANVIRMGIGAKIAGAEANDTFYIDGFDIYHASEN